MGRASNHLRPTGIVMYVNSISVLMDAEVRHANFVAMRQEAATFESLSEETRDRHDRMHKAWRVMTGAECNDEGTYEDFVRHAKNYVEAYESYDKARKVRIASQQRLDKYRRDFQN